MSQYEYGSGGGFLQGGSPYSAGGSPSGARKEASHSLRPLTIAQLSKATQAHSEADWSIDEVEIGQVTVVGQVVSVQVQTTNCVYWIDDGTGRIEARHWVDSNSEEDREKWGDIQERTYLRVTGSLKTFGSKRYVNATHIRTTTDPHEIYFHILEAIATTLMVDKQGQPSGNIVTSGAGTSAGAYAQSSSSVPVNDQFSHLPGIQQKIVRYILNQPRTDEGVNVALIARAVGKEGDAEQISDALDKLMDEGLVYSTIDDSHFNVAT